MMGSGLRVAKRAAVAQPRQLFEKLHFQ
ncbi:TPA: hypothetical protein ANIA_11636 [Aspergillus nidulans FGSC A4]|uniref:Uncharacterized protein n=1 Tax=Emericella nidulans (strain FGSC A4 / ATCC 38163 / CBS 112.46 / NRRL 194 / M139) TaxID=227321 RepID=C8VLA1_EMENI|nr:TPA: hypothetical protein ANIA_11636 [Aspergillus nidulans FGSC A4]